MQLNRRKFVAGTGLALAVSSLGGISPAAAHPHRLDPTNPVDRLRAMVRLRGSEHQPIWTTFQGEFYVRGPDNVIKPILRFTSLMRFRYRKINDETYHFDQRESLHFSDIETGEPVGEFNHPYKDKPGYAIGYLAPIFSYDFDLKGVRSDKHEGHIGEMPVLLEEQNGLLQTSERRVSVYEALIDREMFPDAYVGKTHSAVDVVTYRAPAEDIYNPEIPFVPSVVDFIGDVAWPLWMFMGDRDDKCLFIGHGTQMEHAHELPEDMVRRVEQVHPGYIEDPWGVDTIYTGPQMIDLRKRGII